ncbi:MAG: hypothetical protein QM688_07675 [Sphingomonas bacterium]
MSGGNDRRAQPFHRNADLRHGRAMVRFHFPKSHIFPGARLTVEDDGETGAHCMLEFGDGVTILADVSPQADGYFLTVPDYRTAKGTLVAARTWRLLRRAGDDWRADRA